MTRAERKKVREAKINEYEHIIIDAMLSWAKVVRDVDNRKPSLQEVLLHADVEVVRQCHKRPLEKPFIYAAIGTVRRKLIEKLKEVYGEEQQKES